MQDNRLAWQVYLDGRRKWPTIHVEFEAFQSRCERAFASLAAGEELVHGADLYICSACADGNADALKLFERHLLPTVAGAAVARIDSDPEFVSETLQELSVKLLVGPDARIAEYGGRGPLEAWLRVAAVRVALDRVRQRRPAANADEIEGATNESASPESRLTRERFAGAFQSALIGAMKQLAPRDRNVLRMHAIGGCSVDQIGRAYHVHRATAARWLERAKARVFEGVRNQVAKQTRLTDSEFKSVAGALCDELKFGFSIDVKSLSAERSSRSADG